ncbi:MAG: glycosyltransferase family 4 protein [Cyanobacteria bacterium]|nr:glycosyltransferase family 4 protein [Cyanobacteriota bacterium]
MRILMLSATFPYPPTNGGTQVRTFNLLKYLHLRHEVTIATLRNSDVTPTDIAALKEFATEVFVFDRPAAPNLNLISKLQRSVDFLITGTPPGVRSSYSPDFQAWLDRAVKDEKFDVITCEHSVNENYLNPNLKHSLRTVVNVHSSVYATCKNQLETKTAEKPFRDRLNQPLLKRYEQRFSQKFSTIVVTTDDDAQQFQTFAPNTPIVTIPNGVDFDDFPYRSADPNNHDLIFIGAMDNLANIDAARFLAQEIFPIVQQRYPDSNLMLVGSRPVPEVLELNQLPNVVVTGAVPSIADYLHRASVCVIPMRTGFGIKNKTLEAMAAGTPVVSSDRGLEGLTLDPDCPCALRANNPSEYSAAITQLLDNIALRESISHHARAYIERDFTWEQAGRRYESAILGA